MDNLAKILSDFCLDIAKAYFIGTIVTSSFGTIPYEINNGILIRGLLSVTLLLLLSWLFAQGRNKK